MSYTLIIVESPAKCQKIESFLGPGYKCVASFGHIQQLITLKDVDISNNFLPKFTPIDSKKQQIHKIRQLVPQSKEVIIATDDDREGEGIGWHICQMFNLPIASTKRILFREITKSAIIHAVNNPTRLNMDLVNAQVGRQILDLLVGFKISPVLWENISRTKKGLSAGRCQTPAVRIIYENQKDIDNSPGSKTYNTTGYFTDKNLPFVLNHNHNEEDKMVDFLEETTEHQHKLSCDKPKNSIRKAPQPFTTSTLQQAASNELHISPKETMSICQKLYEGGYITYMRTDSKIYSAEFVEKAMTYIKSKYGEEYQTKDILQLTNATTTKKTKKKDTKKDDKKDSKKDKDKDNMAQEAHEAIRPTNITIDNLPDGDFTSKDIRLYRLIWKTTAESCMSDAIYMTMLAKITAPQKLEYRYTGEEVSFAGWKIIEQLKSGSIVDATKNLAYTYLPKIKDSNLNYKKITSKLTMKDLKTHYTEAKLVQLLEQKGIGRPSTFSALIEKIQERGYVKKENIKGKKIDCIDFELENDEILELATKREFGNENNKLVIQPTGILVIEFLLKTYQNLFEYDYTKQMEDVLDSIAKGNKAYHELCQECLVEIDKATGANPRNNKEDIIIDDNHTYMIGKFGPVIKRIASNNETQFISVRKDLDLDKLRKGQYNLHDITEEANLNKKLGSYKGSDLILKRGKYGLYVIWSDNKKSINSIETKVEDITIDDVIPLIEAVPTSNILRELSPNITIRKGQYGDYIFYKTPKMAKPKFYKLNGFKDDYINCDKTTLISWIKDMYKI